MMLYTIIRGSNVHSTETLVKRHINDGWEPLGGPFVDNFGNILQAMIKEG